MSDSGGVRTRLEWLGLRDDDMDDSALLLLTLAQAVGALGGLGGLAHLGGPEGGLRLAAVSGVPTGIARLWDELSSTSSVAPARAVALGEVVWSDHWPSTVEGRRPAGVVSAPLTSSDGTPIGALSILLDGPPEDAARQALRAFAAAASARLPKVHHWRSGATPWWQQPGGASRRRMMREVSVGLWRWDLTSGLLDFDEITEGLIRLAGLDAGTWDRHISGWMARIHPDDRPGVEAAIQRSFEDGRPFAVVYRVLDRQGQVSWLELRAAFERTDEGPAQMVGTAWNVSAQQQQDAWLVGLLERHPDPVYVHAADDRAEWSNAAANRLAARTGVEITGRVPWEEIPQLRGQGLPELLDRVRSVPDSDSSTTVRVQWSGDRTSWYAVRAVDVGGLVATQWSDITAQTEAEQAAARRSRQLEALNDALIRAVDTSDVVAAVEHHVLPMVGADGLVVYSLTGPAPRLAGITGHSAGFLDAMEAVAWPERLEATALAAGPQFISSVTELGRQWPHLLPLATLGGRQAWAVTPLIVGEQTVGSAVYTWREPRNFTPDDRALLGTVGVVIAHALRAAAAYEEAQRRAEHLQQELLPGPLPHLPGLASAVRYRSDATGVGGHWYDVVPLPGGRVLLAVGDVTAGPDETVAMGILRQSVLTMASQDLPPDELLAHVGDVAQRLGTRLGGAAVTATCLLAHYDPTLGVCTLASAGHAPPVLLSPGRPPEPVRMPVGEPLGAARVPAEATTLPLPPGTLLLLHTSGLLHGSDGAVQPLIDAVARHQAASPPIEATRGDARAQWLERLCDTVTDDLPGALPEMALLTVVTDRLPQGHVRQWTLPHDPESAGQARDLISDALADWGLPDLADATTLIVSELVGNTVRHAGGLPGDTIQVRLLNIGDGGGGEDADDAGGGAVCEVYDGSKATPQVRHPSFEEEFGRGLLLVALSAQSWGTRYTHAGKCIWATVASPDA